MKKRHKKSYKFSKSQLPQLLKWASNHECFSFLNGNKYPALHGSFPELLFVGKTEVIESSENSFDKLSKKMEKKKDWYYGYFCYELKNEIEALESKNPSSIPVDHLGFFVPETIIHIQQTEIIIESFHEPEEVFDEIIKCVVSAESQKFAMEPIIALTPKWQYLDHINKIKSEIIEGEFYEINYCIEFRTKVISFDPLNCYQQLNVISPMPFSAFMRFGSNYLICASPERFLKKEGDKIISQPIKGTIRRSFDKTEDESLKQSLKESEKERAENLMIVDLVRNDLAKSACPGSVKVDELFGIYTFNKVHQMISTVTAKHKQSVDITDIIKHAFPMGSITGAPKIRVMEEIESLEHSSRGLYSGAIGYFSPEGNFDFNVVIRSIIYNSKTKTISFHVGSAITYDSDPKYEYNECLLKAESLMQVLS